MRSRAAVALLATLLSACSMAPPYAVPATAPPPPAFKEGGPWTTAAPADGEPRGDWWGVFGDPVLAALEARVEVASPRLAQAVARFDQANALVRRARADQLPQVDVGASAERGRGIGAGGVHGLQRDISLVAGASYEVDLWGRIRSAVTGARADAQASANDIAVARLSIQAELASDYFRLRGADDQIAALRETIFAYQGALDLTSNRLREGAASEIEVDRARTQLAGAQSQLEQAVGDRAVFEHAIAVLVGEQASSFSVAAVAGTTAVPRIPTTAPSTLLQRRPDVASAERRVAAANARIGSARAALFPSLTLGGSGGFESTAGQIIGSGATVWALGPAVALLSVFDGGRKRADVSRARAEFEEAAANYRQVVLDSFREVEDQLALTNRLGAAAERQDEAVVAARRANALAGIRYREGATDFLAVVIAQTAELDTRRAAIDLRTRRLVSGVDLIRAFGGGWRPAD